MDAEGPKEGLSNSEADAKEGRASVLLIDHIQYPQKMDTFCRLGPARA